MTDFTYEKGLIILRQLSAALNAGDDPLPNGDDIRPMLDKYERLTLQILDPLRKAASQSDNTSEPDPTDSAQADDATPAAASPPADEPQATDDSQPEKDDRKSITIFGLTFRLHKH